MFKLESYITPVILSYVEKYVKNFKPEQSQVSLWGGDASFQNLDLRLEVLEEQLNLPFTFVSGHIHELLIHVPWVKITSEPIVVTINTMECILNLKDQGQTESGTSIPRGSGQQALQEDAPPGYMKSIVAKVINNITINCNNLILKYVEEDIVLSVNVRFLSMQTVNDLWVPTFTDVSSYEVTLRKLITVEDLTLCLDKMDTAGKIEVYQDPVLYRCSMVIRAMMNYHSNVAKCASLTRFDLHCGKMEFSMTEQQLPMLLRLIALITALQAKQLGVRRDKPIVSSDERGEIVQDDADPVHGTGPEGPSWGGWAWNTVASFLPVTWDSDWSENQQIATTGHIIHVGFYIDDAVLTFKTVESLQDQLFYKSRKIRYNSFLTLRVTGTGMSMMMKGMGMSNVRFGLGTIRLHPRGACSCGYQEVVDGVQPPLYMIAGSSREDYLKDSLFEKDTVENIDIKNYYRDYDIDYHLAKFDVASMLERFPAFGMDIVHSIEIPEDFPVEKVLEFGSNFEYSNFPERRVVRYVVGDLKIRLCSGLMHRIEAVKRAAKYDRNRYVVKKQEPTVEELPPVTVEEYEALRENVSVIETYFNVNKLSVQFQLTDHSAMKLPGHVTAATEDSQSTTLDPALSNDPHLSVETEQIVASLVQPMYAFRLASCASRQAEISSDMLNDCYSVANIKISGIQSQLYLTKNCHNLIVMPCNATCNKKSLVYPQYWRSTNLVNDLIDLEIDGITFTGTKPKLLVATSIARSIKDPTDNSNPLFCSSLFADACDEKDSIYLEVSLENVRCKRLKSSSTVSMMVNVDSIKAFALNDEQQAFILSGPEVETHGEMDNSVLLTAVLQYSEPILDLVHPPIFSFRVAEMRCSLDPLFREWFEYQAIIYKSSKVDTSLRPGTEQPPVEETSSGTGVRKKRFRTLHDSVHSVSDKEKKKSGSRTDWSKGVSGGEEVEKNAPSNEDIELTDLRKSTVFITVTELYPFWRKLVLCGFVGHLVIYIPTTTMDGIGAVGIELAKDRALERDSSLQIFAIKCPTVLIHSVNVQLEQLSQHLEKLPARLPSIMWPKEYHSFPWTFSLNNLQCFTLKKNCRKNLIRKVDLTATIDIATKPVVPEVIEGSLVGLGLCVYVDTSPVVIFLSEDQVSLLNKVAADMASISKMLYSPGEKAPNVCAPHTDVEHLFSDMQKSPSSYTQVFYAEDTATPSSISTAHDDSERETESVVITAMIQWTIMKIALKLYVTEESTDASTKLVLELEDIITTLDWQPIYLKLKNKITTATIYHYARNGQDRHWELGEYGGLIMCGRESSPEIENTAFLGVTLTKAQSGNVHTRWGAQKHQKSHKTHAKRDRSLLSAGYITEIDVNLQMVDVILPLGILNKFILLTKPFMLANSEGSDERWSAIEQEETTTSSSSFLENEKFNSKSLPLIYLEFKGMNFMVPIFGSADRGLRHDLLMLQLDGISITPSAENPICRTIIRSDIYQLAAQSNILNVPGSAVEDRQYQVNMNGIFACTTTWKNYQRNVTKRMSQSYLYTMNENPALEWNNLVSESNLEPQFSTSPLLSRFDIRLIFAPAVVLCPLKVVCGSAFEATSLTDIDVSMNFDQIELLWLMYSETMLVLADHCDFSTQSNCSTKTQDATPVPSPPRLISQGFSSSKETREPDYAADSGIDFESSSVNFPNTTNKLSWHEKSSPIPSEIFVNCGTVAVSLYLVTKSATSLSEKTAEVVECAEDEKSYSKSLLLYAIMREPNFYVSQLHGTEKVQVSCFDVAVALGNFEENAKSPVANRADSKFWIVETKSGDSHPETGIPPSFLVVKCEKALNTSPQLLVEMGRPTKLNCSIPAFKHVEYVRNKVAACFVNRNALDSVEEQISRVPPPRSSRNIAERKSGRFDSPDLTFKTKQIVLSLSTNSDSKILISVASSSGNTSRTTKPERIYGNLSLNSFIMSGSHGKETKVFLNPWCCHVTVYLLWESWQDCEADPQIQIQADSESMYFEFGPQQMTILGKAMEAYYAFVDYLGWQKTSQVDGEKTKYDATTEQHYKDDLKAGAFQFVEGHADELPLPYQVVFYTSPEKAMAWRYPQPRVITGLQVAPIPFEITENANVQLDPVPCVLEYWSESHVSYQRYVDLVLSETDSYSPELPATPPAQAVASVWRVVLPAATIPRHASSVLSPQVLVACLRVDSYFNASLIPKFQAALNIGTINLSFFNHVKSSAYARLPHPLANFRLNGLVPEAQCFLQLQQNASLLVLNRWSSGSVLVDLSGELSVKVLDYSFLSMQQVLERLEAKVQISLVEDSKNVSVECNPFDIKFGPSVAHTLAVSANLWLAAQSTDEKNVAILTRVVVANDSNVAIRFGQSGSADNILLQSRQCYFYAWRRANNRLLRVAMESTGWTWSQPFSVKKNGRQLVIFGNSSSGNSVLCARVSSLSATQKLITFSGLLVVTNRLAEHFEMKIVRYRTEGGNSKAVVSDELHEIRGSGRAPSIVLDSNLDIAMRLRFATNTSLSWTGDIPLKPNSKWGQPWLVKVPLQERGQFLSIWTRIVEEAINGTIRVLAVLSPLYMIKSYLPVPVKVQIETPSLRTCLNATINGRGERQQLYCPGTFEHSHQLTFQFEAGISASNPYVPLSYSSVEQRKFFKRPENEDIDAILAELENHVDTFHWPFQVNDPNIWIPAQQPHTHVQVKYQDAGMVSSTLLLELQPWCFILNTLGCEVAIISEDIELCRVPHHGIITPPKLEGTFHLKINIDDENDYSSPALQLARLDWSQGFYMPRIRGLIPVEGNVKTSIDCGTNVCIVSINSKMHEDMRVVRMSTSHVICNFTPHELRVATLAVDETSSSLDFPADNNLYSFNVSPTQDRSQGIPVVLWHRIETENVPEQVAFHVSLSRDNRWSCPIRVDQSVARRCIAISDEASSVPVVVTIQEDKGTTYILIHIDDHPQLYIENSCPFRLLLGEANAVTETASLESPHFLWRCEVEYGEASYYSAPNVGGRLPDGQTTEQLPKLLLSAMPQNHEEEQRADRKNVSWSRPINTSQVANGRVEQYVRLPVYGDVKLLMEKRCHTICLRVLCMSQVDVSARDIRSRLIFKETESPFVKLERLSLGEDADAGSLASNVCSPTWTSATSVPHFRDYAMDDERKKMVSQESLAQSDDRSPTTAVSRKGSLTVYVRGANVSLMQDINERSQRVEVASLCLSDLIVTTVSNPRSLTLTVLIGDFQLDNQMFDHGGFDFPVVLINQHPYTARGPRFCAKSSSKQNIEAESLFVVDCAWEVEGPLYACKHVRVKIGPISAYIEDTFITHLLEYTTSTVPPCLVISSEPNTRQMKLLPTAVTVPEYIIIDSANLRSPLRLQRFTIEPISVLLSVHTSVRLYVALDHSPLYFGTFERDHLLTTPYRLGNALTMHYLSGAIFGAGWVVGSLEILGSPGGFAQALGYGLRDFIALPIQGLLQGPWGFLIGITHGSASLMKHLTAGTVNSVTKLASSVARNLDRLTLDEEHLQRQEESRRTRPQGMAQGLYQGLTGFGMSLLAAVAGLAHHPLQQVLSGEATTRGLVTGVGLGIVGAVTKPLSGAAELVALTGQGLLEGTGWNPLPAPRQKAAIECLDEANNSSAQYSWRLLPLLAKNRDSILHVTSANYLTNDGVNRAVMLILTRQSLLLLNVAEDSVEKILFLKELTSAEHNTDPTLLCLYCPPTKKQPERSSSPVEYPEMDEAMRARVEQFVRGSSTGCASLSTTSYVQSESIESPQTYPDNTLTFYVRPEQRNYLISLFEAAKRQGQGNDFNVL